MPSIWHDEYTRFIKATPQLAVDLDRQLFGIKVPAGAAVNPAGEVHSTRQPKDLITDRTILVGPPHKPLRALVTEVERRGTPRKRRQIPRYAMAASLYYECPADVLVFCRTEATARYYARPVPAAAEDNLFYPKAVWPSRVPEITDPALVTANPGMGLLSVIYRGQNPAVADAFLEGIAALGPDLQHEYHEYAHVLSPHKVRDVLEAIVTMTQTRRYSPLAKRNYAEGELNGKRYAVRMAARARGLTLTDDQSAKIDTCEELATLERWAEAAVDATDASDIFK